MKIREIEIDRWVDVSFGVSLLELAPSQKAERRPYEQETQNKELGIRFELRLPGVQSSLRG